MCSRSDSNKPKTGLLSERTRSRVSAMKVLYQYFVVDNQDSLTIKSFLEDDPDYLRCNKDYFLILFDGIFSRLDELLAQLQEFLDRPFSQITPIEKAILVLSFFELRHQKSVPPPVVINEAIELAKIYGGTDGYKYVNSVLDQVLTSSSD